MPSRVTIMSLSRGHMVISCVCISIEANVHQCLMIVTLHSGRCHQRGSRSSCRLCAEARHGSERRQDCQEAAERPRVFLLPTGLKFLNYYLSNMRVARSSCGARTRTKKYDLNCSMRSRSERRRQASARSLTTTGLRLTKLESASSRRQSASLACRSTSRRPRSRRRVGDVSYGDNASMLWQVQSASISIIWILSHGVPRCHMSCVRIVARMPCIMCQVVEIS